MTRPEAKKALKAQLTPEFLATIIEVFRFVGPADPWEVWDFVNDCHRIAGVPCDRDNWPEPYTFEDD